MLCLLRMVFRCKEVQAKEKLIYVDFNFREKKVEGSLDRLRHNTCGEVFEAEFKHAKYKGNYKYSINVENAGKAHELFTSKSSARRFAIHVNNSLIFTYFHMGVFETQLINDWINF